MKRLIVLGSLALAGCAGQAPTPSAGPGVLSPLVSTNIISENTRTKARQVQATTKELCQFIPTLGTIAALFSVGAGAGVAAIASDVCMAVTNIPLADGGPRAAKVYGVPIKGKFVR